MRQIAVILVLAVLLAAFVFIKSAQAPFASLTQAKVFGFIDQCTRQLNASGSDYIVCCLEGNFVKQCGNKFSPGELFSVQANLQRLSRNDAYYACLVKGGFQRTSQPPRFSSHQSLEGFYQGREISCAAEPFYRKDFHTAAVTGFAPAEKGAFSIIDVYILPQGNYKSIDDFLAALDETKKVFNLEGDVQ